MNLYEDTYNTLKYAKVARQVYTKLFVLGHNHVDISRYFDELPVYWSIHVLPLKSGPESKYRGFASYNNKTKDNYIEVKNTGKEDSIKTIRHEIIHVLDYVSMLKNNGSIPEKIHNRSTLLAYKMDAMEFNELIHAAKYYKEKNKRKYDKISSYEDFIKVIMVNDDKLFFKNFSKSDLKHLLKDETIKVKILKRLNREGLLPSEM